MLLRRKQLLVAEQRMTFAEKFFRLRQRLRDPQWRRYGKLLLAGKMLGIAAVLALMIGIPTIVREVPKMLAPAVAQAQDKPADQPAATPVAATPAPDPYTTVKPGDIVNPVNTTWTLIAAFLVFGMQVGFTMLGSRVLPLA